VPPDRFGHAPRALGRPSRHKPRVVPIPHPLAAAFGEYLADLRPTLAVSPYLFANPNAHRGGQGRHNRESVHGLVQEAGADSARRWAGVTSTQAFAFI